MVRVGRPDGSEGVAVPARIVALALVALFAFVVTFPSLRAYLSQQAQYDAIMDQLAQAKETSTHLEDQLAQWQDDDYVRSQARQRLFYVMPGETTYVVLGAEDAEQAALDQEKAGADVSRPWYEVLRDSAAAAGAANQVSVSGPVWPDSVPSPGASGSVQPTPGASPATAGDEPAGDTGGTASDGQDSLGGGSGQ